MGTKRKKQKWEKLKEEDYYYYSRCRFWTVLEFVRLVFNDARWEFDPKDPHQKYIEEIKKANHGWRISDFDLEVLVERNRNSRLTVCRQYPSGFESNFLSATLVRFMNPS